MRDDKRRGCVCVLCVPCLCMHLPACMLRGCHTVTAVTQPWSQGGEKDGKGRVVREEVKILVWSDGANAGEACVRMRLCVCVGENDK